MASTRPAVGRVQSGNVASLASPKSGNVATLKQNGPAEAATSPSHGSHPSVEKDLNAMDTITAPHSGASRLGDLIAAHRGAYSVYQSACHVADVCETPAHEAVFDAAHKVEEAARHELISHRVETAEEVGQKLAYLYSAGGPWKDFGPDGDELDMLFVSLGVEARA